MTTPAPRLLTAPGSRMEVVLCDIDSTLADTRHRRHLCPTVDPTREPGPYAWDTYAMACGGDTPIAGTVTALRMFYAAGYGVHLVSNRPHLVLQPTVTWLAQHRIPYSNIRLRQGEETFDSDLKVRYLGLVRARGYHPVLFLEDWPAEAAAIEAAGVPVLCVNPRYGDGHPG